MRYLVKFDFGLYDAFGESVEIMTEDEFKTMKEFVSDGKEVYLGEIAGKHSEIYGPLEEKDYTVLSTDEAEIVVFEKLLGECFGAFCMSEEITQVLEQE